MRPVLILVLVATTGFYAGCARTVQERRLTFYRQEFKSYPEGMKKDIRDGRLREGMSREQVYLTRGVPDAIERAVESPEVEEKWAYYGFRGERWVVEFRRGSVTKISIFKQGLLSLP